MKTRLFCCFLIASIHIQTVEARFPEYGSRECANCYDQQDDCYRQNGSGCTNGILPCIQGNCTKTKLPTP